MNGYNIALLRLILCLNMLPESERVCPGICNFTATNNEGTATTSIGGNLMEGIAELIIQPTVARIGTGSGSSDNTLDHNKDKNKQRKGGRRR